MKWREVKYLIAYIIPLSAYWAIFQQGWWSYSTIVFAFGLIPILDALLPVDRENVTADQRKLLLDIPLFDWLLYLNVPLVYGVVCYFAWTLGHQELAIFEQIGLLFSVGIVIGSNGINVAHELGHRRAKHERRLAKMLLCPGLYMHFYVEHNQGHHKYVATALDPASATRGQHVYAFWWQSTIGSYKQAWQIQLKNLSLRGQAFWSWHNEMLWYQLIQLAYVLSFGLWLGLGPMAWVIGAGVIGFLLLETINYIEHYGLRRKKLPNGRYERVQPYHSWNADYELGRIVLYELTRHSDHHYLASKKYQILDHHDQAPQLPVGYPAAMMLALVPPLWFQTMNPRLEAFEASMTIS